MQKEIIIDGEVFDSETGELINKIEQVEVEIIENNLPAIVCDGGTHIKTNTVQLKKELTEYLKRYDIEVTEENEKDCSKIATELNKLSKDLDSKRKEVASLIKKPADDLKTEVDSLVSLIQDKRNKIIDGVNVFKNARFEKIRALLKAKLNVLYIQEKIEDRYRNIDIEPLVLEGSLAKTELTKKAIETLESMVLRVKNIQQSVKLREMELSLKSKESGLITQIELCEVQHIIEDENYEELLSQMINKRLEIQNEAKKQFELQEQQKKENERLVEIKKQEAEEYEQRKAREQKIEIEKTTGKKIVRILAEFDVEVGVDTEDIKVLLKYKEKLSEMFSTLKDVSILEDDLALTVK